MPKTVTPTPIIARPPTLPTIPVVAAVQHINQDNRWHVSLKAYNAVNSTQTTALYASDRDCSSSWSTRRAIELDGHTYFRGFYTWNSEVGKAAFGLASFLYSYVCANRIIWGARDVEELRIRHTSLAPDRIVEQARPALVAMSEATPQPIVEAIRKAKTTRVGKTVAEVEAWLAGWQGLRPGRVEAGRRPGPARWRHRLQRRPYQCVGPGPGRNRRRACHRPHRQPPGDDRRGTGWRVGRSRGLLSVGAGCAVRPSADGRVSCANPLPDCVRGAGVDPLAPPFPGEPTP